LTELMRIFRERCLQNEPHAARHGNPVIDDDEIN